MRLLRCFIVAVLAPIAVGQDALAQQPLPDGFIGMFRGTLSGASGNGGGEFTVSIKANGEGFAVAWPPRVTASFEPAGRPGVFRTDVSPRLLGGEPVHWARIENGTLTVYSALIDEQGGYHVDSFIYTANAGGLDLVIRRIVTGAEPQISSGRLNRYGG